MMGPFKVPNEASFPPAEPVRHRLAINSRTSFEVISVKRANSKGFKSRTSGDQSICDDEQEQKGSTSSARQRVSPIGHAGSAPMARLMCPADP